MTTLSNFCFTINNYTPTIMEGLEEYECGYIIFGEEVAPTTGTKHLQGYCELIVKTKFNTVKKSFPKGAHIEKRRGTQAQAITYCKKDGKYHEFGLPKNQGARNDIRAVRELIVVNKVNSVKACIEKLPSMNFQTLRIIDRLLPMYEQARDWKPYVYWLYGTAGTGKTRFAYKILGKDCYTMNYASKFFLDYDADEYVLYDDFRKNSIPFNELLRQLDRYQYKVEIKGGSRQFVPRVIVVTSDKHPSEMWQDNDFDQIIRRIDSVYNFS